MKTSKFKIYVCVALLMCLSLALASPAMAATVQPRSGAVSRGWYPMGIAGSPGAGPGWSPKVVNINGQATVTNGSSVTVYSDTGATEQLWWTTRGAGTIQRCYSRLGISMNSNGSVRSGYALNYNNSNGRCIMWYDTQATDACSQITLSDYGYAEVALILSGKGLYLTVSGYNNGNYLYWAASRRNASTAEYYTQAFQIQ